MNENHWKGRDHAGAGIAAAAASDCRMGAEGAGLPMSAQITRISPNWLRLHGKIREAIASDLRPGPLERARNTGRLYGTDGIEYRLCSGLSEIRPSEVDTIVIAGMGGETILSILKAAPWTADDHHTLLLQPQTHEELVRQYLAENGFIITREALVRDRGTLYTVMEARAGKAGADAYTDLGRRLPFAGSFG